jgi:hypothetical protein
MLDNTQVVKGTETVMPIKVSALNILVEAIPETHSCYWYKIERALARSYRMILKEYTSVEDFLIPISDFRLLTQYDGPIVTKEICP